MSNTKLGVDTLRTTLTTRSAMKSVRFHGRGDIRVDFLEEPVCGRGEVKMRPAYVGICGTDIHEYTSGPVLIPSTPHPITKTTFPVTLGHEFSGIIEEVGEDVTNVSPGQRAVVRPTIFDRTCVSCRMGVEYCCENIGFIGISGYGGGMAKHIVAPSDHFYPLPETISLKSAALIEPLSVAWHAVSISPFQANDNTLVLGSGPIGIGLIQVLRLRGARRIIVSEMLPSRKKLALEYGATAVVDPRECDDNDIAAKVKALTDGKGADVTFDTAGVEAALNSAIRATRCHGTVVNIAVWERRPAVGVNELMYREVNYMGAALYDEEAFRGVIRAVESGQLNPDKMITATVSLDEVVEKGFQRLVEQRGEHCKIVVDVNDGDTRDDEDMRR